MSIDRNYWLQDRIMFRGLAIASLLASVFMAGCEMSDAEENAFQPPEVDVAEVLVEPVTLTETLTGRLEAPETVNLRARVTGYIQQVAFKEGALVEAGDLLFQIDPRPYQAQLNAAKAELAQSQSQLELAESEAKRARLLLEDKAISSEEHDQRQAALFNARARVELSKAALELAELDMQYTQVVSPINGRAGRARITRGNLANADQTLLTTVVSVDPLHVYFDGDENMALSSQEMISVREVPNRVQIGFGGDEDFPHEGVLDYVANQLNVNTGTQQYRAVLDNSEGLLKPGQFARVKMPVASLEQAILVDRKSVLTDQDRLYVYVVNNENIVERREVNAGSEVNDLLIINSGLKAGDRVIVNGLQKVFGPGMPVSPRQVAMRQDSSETMVALTSVATP